ncbi:MAG: LysR family transcriptional regulator, partial [Myxococcaceae bacterium]|nr:LysR family transcriptional regulator [Myxococcaceae bacterium]
EVECFHLQSMDEPPRAWYPPSVQNRIALGAKRVGELFSREAFTLAATAGSFSAAAKRLNVNVSSIARAVERLESSLGARLFARSTHGIALTEAGRLYLTHCQHLLASEQGVRDAINSARDEGGGTLRVALPVFLAERVAAAVIAQVRDSHPAAQFDVHASDENVDLVAGAFDLGVRLGPLADSALRTRRITSLSRSLYIAKKAHWAPLKTPKDLTKVPCLCYGNGSGPVKWSFRHQGRREDISLTPLVRTNHLTLLIALAEAGQGVALLPDWASQGVRGLTAVLAEWCQLPKHLEPALYAVFPHDRGKARLREAFIEGITRALSAAV